MPDHLLVVEALRKRFGDLAAVDGVDFTLDRGRIHGMLGRNGAGKTTTLRMILGIFFPDGGNISLFGAPWSAAALDRVGYLPEERGMYRKMKLLEHLRFFCALKGKRGPGVEERLRELLERFALWERREEAVEALSKGNQQKAQLAGVLAFDPDLIILDEPMSGLDPVNVVLVRELLQELKAAGKTLLLSTHMMDEAERLCDTVTLIHKGKVVLAGETGRVQREFGARKIQLEFAGDGAGLRGLPGVASAQVDTTRATLTLAKGVEPRAVLRGALEKVEIRRFDSGLASLEEIFIRTVGDELNAGEAS